MLPCQFVKLLVRLLGMKSLHELDLRRTRPRSSVLVRYMANESLLTSSFVIVLNSPGAAPLPVIALTAMSIVRPTAPRVAIQ